ncbi:MAG: hypothetical protein HY581_06860 [Nitrospirae bacterium]|nr:hypothetical protein [Nitrospirota bacterium]
MAVIVSTNMVKVNMLLEAQLAWIEAIQYSDRTEFLMKIQVDGEATGPVRCVNELHERHEQRSQQG